MKEDYKFVRYCEAELGDGTYTLDSELLILNHDLEEMDTEGAAEDDHSEMEIASVERKTATAKRKREDKPKALKKQTRLVDLRGGMTGKSWEMLNCHTRKE